MRESGRYKCIATIILVICVIGLAVAIGVAIGVSKKVVLDPPDPVNPPGPSNSIEGRYKKAAVATRSDECAQIGRNILSQRGTAVDSAVAVNYCEGVLNSQSMGLGGGFVMTVYIKSNQTGYAITARESAPAGADENMFLGNSTLSQRGGLSIAVPGEVRGYAEAHRLFGNLSWADLVQPTIDLIQDGVPVTKYTSNSFQTYKDSIINSPSMKEIYVNPATGDVWKEGDRYPHPALVRTLRLLRDEGPESFYSGNISRNLVKDIREEFGGIITEEDLKNYTARVEPPLEYNLPQGLRLITTPLPSSGILLGFIMSVMAEFSPAPDETTEMHRLAETFKFAYAKRTLLGDPHYYDVSEIVKNLTSPAYAKEIRNAIVDSQTFNDPEHYGAELYQPDDGGTLHTSILASNGDAVSVTSTVNLAFGAMIRSRSTGIILNDEMDDFSAPNITNAFGVPPSPANFIAPGKIPLSSMCPVIVVDGDGNVRLVSGGAGGTRITTATAIVALRNLYKNQSIKDATDARRLHHQLLPMELGYELGITEGLVNGLKSKGHAMTRYGLTNSAVNSVARGINSSDITANGDFRRLCAVSGID